MNNVIFENEDDNFKTDHYNQDTRTEENQIQSNSNGSSKIGSDDELDKNKSENPDKTQPFWEDVSPPWIDDKDEDSEEEIDDQAQSRRENKSIEDLIPEEVDKLVEESDFDYSPLSDEDTQYLLMKEIELNRLQTSFATDIGKLLYDVQERLKEYPKLFPKWYRSKGLTKSNVYRYIARYKLIQEQPTEEMQDRIENMQLSLAYKLTEENAPEELKSKIMNLEITTNAEMEGWIENNTDPSNEKEDSQDSIRITTQEIEKKVPYLILLLEKKYQKEAEQIVYRILSTLFPKLENHFNRLEQESQKKESSL